MIDHLDCEVCKRQLPPRDVLTVIVQTDFLRPGQGEPKCVCLDCSLILNIAWNSRARAIAVEDQKS